MTRVRVRLRKVGNTDDILLMAISGNIILELSRDGFL